MRAHIESPDVARATLARIALDDEIVPHTVGRITLRPEQRTAAARLSSLIQRDGGAMLADPVGVGKTYTALSIAASAGETLIVAPAALRSMWAESLGACGVTAGFISHESLSRGKRPTGTPSLLIVDEAHRFRSPASRRYAILADVCRPTRVLLLTATPIQNRRTDLSAVLALFLGRRAWEMEEEQLAEHVVRSAADVAAVPRLRGPFLLTLATPDDCLDQLLALPPSVPARDESLAETLLVYGLLHQWTSSRAALAAALRRRQSRGIALLAALSAGRSPSRHELSAWTHCGDAVQLAFPEMVSGDAGEVDDVDALMVAVDRHAAGVNALLHSLRITPDPDDERAALLTKIRRDHSGERIIAFCQYAETVNALRLRLSREPGIAALTAHGARIASGRVSRETVLEQFRPGGRTVSTAQRIDLLLTTDLLSEGLNLQEASVIVHLDFPWNPARLDQRVGRARRFGSRHESVTVYAVAPPAAADRMLHIEQRLREKLSVAQRTVGIAGRILPSALLPNTARGAAERRGAVDARLREWARVADVVALHGEMIVAAVAAPVVGFLCAVRGDDSRLIADVGNGIDSSPECVASAMLIVEDADASATIDRAQLDRTTRRIRAWLQADRGNATVNFTVAAAARSRRRALERVAQAMARAPRHRRAQLADLAAAARQVATAPLGEGAERILETLVKAELPDEAWLRSVAMFGELNVRPEPGRRVPTTREIAVLILFTPTPL
jgi:superfamily II DNA or RNA helicase